MAAKNVAINARNQAYCGGNSFSFVSRKLGQLFQIAMFVSERSEGNVSF